MSVDVGNTIDAVAGVIKAIGDTAQAALQVGDVVLPILQDIGLIVPPAGTAANYLAVALPYIADVARYAPQVQAQMVAHKTLIEAAANVGEAVMSPLTGLLSDIPQLASIHELFGALDAFVKANEFSPQDPRFNRAQGEE